VSRFPVLTETFVLQEISTLQSMGWPVEIFALYRERPAVVQPGARQILPGVHYPTLAGVSLPRPGLLRATIRAHARSPRVLAKALLVAPIAAGWAQQMRALGVEHIHAHFGSYPALAALLAARLLGIGFSFTVHAHDLFADNAMLAEKVRRARFVVTISRYNLERLRGLVGEVGNVHVVHCGVDGNDFSFQPPVDRTCGPRTVVCVAALREYKGLEFLVQACCLLRDQAPAERFVCFIVGEGPARASLDRLIRTERLEQRVVLLGARDHTAVRELLHAADTFVLPSVEARNKYMDGIPVALMEAMASGVPVIASRLSGIPELVRHGDTGLLVEPRRADQIRDALVACWRDEAASLVRAQRARALIERQYDLRTNTSALAALFEGSILA